MERRHFLLGFTAALIVAKSTLSWASQPEISHTVIPLWPGTPPGGGGPVGAVKTSSSGAQRNIAVPTLTVIKPNMPNGHVVLIAGGGGYKRIEMAKEAWPALGSGQHSRAAGRPARAAAVTAAGKAALGAGFFRGWALTRNGCDAPRLSKLCSP